jgi:hypothetical protein
MAVQELPVRVALEATQLFMDQAVVVEREL